MGGEGGVKISHCCDFGEVDGFRCSTLDRLVREKYLLYWGYSDACKERRKTE